MFHHKFQHIILNTFLKHAVCQKKWYLKSLECYTCFGIIDLHINMRWIRLLPSNNPDGTSVIESSLHKKHIHLPLSRFTHSLSLAGPIVHECDITWRGSMCSVDILFIYPHVLSHSRSAFSPKTMWGCGGFVFDPDKYQHTCFMPVWESRIVHPCVNF